MLNPPNGNHPAIKRNEYCRATDLDDLTGIVLREARLSTTKDWVPRETLCRRF